MQIGLGLWLGTRQVGGFSPATLFAAGEQGGWYDPSDLSTMFQDTAGTTPVTATGQTVGLMLDKSQGLALGPELVTNGDFASATGWTLGAGWSIGGGFASIDGTNLATSILNQTTVATVVGRTYLVTYTYSVTAGAIRLNTAQFGTTTSFAAGTSGVYTAYLVAIGTTGSFGVQAQVANTIATIDNISVKELAGNHLTQATAASRPQYQIDANGLPFLLFDGTDDWFISPTITPGIDKVQVFAGVRKLSDATTGALLESSTDAGGNAGSILLMAPPANTSPSYGFYSRGSVAVGVAANSTLSFAAPVTSVVTGLGDIAADNRTVRVNGAVSGTPNTSDQGTGNFLAYPLYVGRRGGTTLPFNGRLYALAVRFGANLSSDQISQMETWMAGKTGLTL